MQPASQPPNYVPRIVVKYREGTQMPYEEKAEKKATTESVRESFRELNQQFPATTLKPLFPDMAVESLREATRSPGVANVDTLPVDDLSLFYWVEPEPGQSVSSLIDSLNSLPDVEYAYLEGGPSVPPAFDPSTNPLVGSQGYMAPAPAGINAFHASNFPGGDGAGVRLIDIEQGWGLDHEDLITAQIRLKWGMNAMHHSHGTAVLGQLVATHNNLGIIGIARGCQVAVVSQWNPAGAFSTAQAILKAVDFLGQGDVLLLEAQVEVPEHSGNNFPVEVEPAVMNVLRYAFNRGIIVIEAAGNGDNHTGNNLDNFVAGPAGTLLNPNTNRFIDSGTIMVGAASSKVPHQRLQFSNFGSRVDCYAWGEHITTTGYIVGSPRKDLYINNFNGTSGASPIIAGAAVVLQAIRQATSGTRFSPREMRALLSNAANGTPSANPALDRIGVMPDLKTILNNIFPGVA